MSIAATTTRGYGSSASEIVTRGYSSGLVVEAALVGGGIASRGYGLSIGAVVTRGYSTGAAVVIDGYFEHIASYKNRVFEATHTERTFTAKHKSKTYEAE